MYADLRVVDALERIAVALERLVPLAENLLPPPPVSLPAPGETCRPHVCGYNTLAKRLEEAEKSLAEAEKKVRVCGKCARQHTSCPYYPPVPFPPDPTKPRGPRDDGPACDKFTRK